MSDQSEREIVLQVEGITKRFPGVLANNDVDLTLHRGEILALLGENGAGKSTLMNIIYGLYHPDEGSIRVQGKEVRFASPREAIQSGIGMVHQHFQLIPVMTVAENVILGEENTATGRTRPPIEESQAAGTIRLIWGVFWRILGPAVATGLGLLMGQVFMLLIFVISSYLPQGADFQTSRFQRLPLWQRAETALVAYYPDHQYLTSILLWSPLVVGSLVGAATIVLGYRHARRTWRGRQRRADYKARVSALDTIIDSVIDLVGTASAVHDKKRAADQVHELSRQFNLEVDADAYIEKLPVGIQQRVEIIKALYRHAGILILDEPTAVLTPQESKELFRIMRDLAVQGVSIIFITHKLKEVFAVADSIVVMRNGIVVGATTPAEATEESLANMMVGREVMLKVDKKRARPGDVVLAVEDLSAVDDRGTLIVDHVGFEVRAGEVLGVAGVQGNGQTELVEVLTGLRKAASGHMKIGGVTCKGSDPREITLLDAAHVPEDRHLYGMVTSFPIADNLVLNQYFRAPFAAFPSQQQLPLALAFYVEVFSACIFALLALVWVPLWPNIQTTLRLGELSPRQDAGPFILALFIALVMAILGVIVAHRLTIFILGLARGGLLRLIAADLKRQGQHAFPPGEVLGLGSALVAGAAFISLPWFNSLPGITSTGWQLLTDTQPTFIDVAPLLLIVLAIVIGGVGALWGLLSARASRFAAMITLLAGLPGLAYYGLFLVQNGQGPVNMLGMLGAGFFVVLIATLGLILQALIPRPEAASGALGTDAGGGMTVNNAAVETNAARLVEEFDIRTPSSALNASTLSGGNQQKMVVAREFSRKPRLLIASQPTRGIDVGSIEFIHQRIIRQRDEGAAVLLVSAELDEIMTLSDRIAVMYKGRIIDVVPGGAATREQLGLLMAGIRRDWQAPWRSVAEVAEPREQG